MDNKERADLGDILKKAKLKVRTDNQKTGFCEMLAHYMNEAGYSCKSLASIANMSEATIRRMKNVDDYMPTREMIISVCVALKLSIYDSRVLLRKSPFRLQEDSPVDAIYLKILEYEGKYTVHEWNTVLRKISASIWLKEISMLCMMLTLSLCAYSFEVDN